MNKLKPTTKQGEKIMQQAKQQAALTIPLPLQEQHVSRHIPQQQQSPIAHVRREKKVPSWIRKIVKYATTVYGGEVDDLTYSARQQMCGQCQYASRQHTAYDGVGVVISTHCMAENGEAGPSRKGCGCNARDTFACRDRKNLFIASECPKGYFGAGNMSAEMVQIMYLKKEVQALRSDK